MGNYLHHIWFGYAWPSLQGNGPEDLIRTTIALILAAIILPQVRRFFERGWEKLHGKLDALGGHHAKTQKMLQHIIDHHPDIPEMKQ